MKTLYLDCHMGLAGDMLFSALFELIEDKSAFINEFSNIGLPSFYVKVEQIVKNGIGGTKSYFSFDGRIEGDDWQNGKPGHHHPTLSNITDLINSLKINDNVKKNVLDIYSIIANAESIVHKKNVNEIHFHEVGALDAIADITGVCMLIDLLKPDTIISSPICVGYGQVKCAHGILPVPAPATALILKDTPIYAGNIEGELCTPTGAALISYFAANYSQMPLLTNYKVGYGMGTKDFEALNCVRAFYSNNEISESRIIELNCNIDDMTAEDLSFATKILFENGALDVFTVPINMKKNRPGTLLSCICNEADEKILAELIFKHTSTLGIRKNTLSRYTLERNLRIIDTKYGKVRIKKSSGFNIEKSKIEHDDLEQIALKENLSINEIRKNIMAEIKGL